VVRWWAAFFIAGLVSPPDGRAGLTAALVAGGLALGTAATAMRMPWVRLGRFGRERFTRALASFAICSASSIIIWQAAGLDRPARDCSGARSGGSGTGLRVASATQAALRGAGRSVHPSGIRSLSLSGARLRLLDALDDGRLTGRARGLVGALILDDRSGLDFKISEMYSYVGITHFLALSGMHLGAIAIPLSGLLSRFIRSKRRSDIALLAILCLYSAVAGFPASLLRALFLSAAIIAYRFIGMHADLIGSLVAGSCVLVAIDSSIAFDVGFQLSFAAVCGIAFIALPLSKRLEARMPGGFGGTIVKAVVFPALITCSVQFLTMPLVICLFKRVSLYSPVVNVIVSLPYTVLLYAGLLYVFIPLGPMRALLAVGINPLCRFLEAAPGIFTRGPHAALYRGDFNIDMYLCGAALAAWALQKSCPRRRMILIAGVACVTLAFLVPAARRSTATESRTAEHSPEADSVRRVSCKGAEYLGAGKGIIFLGDGFGSGDAYRFTRSLWAEGVRRAGRCVVAPSQLRRNHGLYYLLKRIRVDEVLCSRYLLLRDADLPARLEAHGAKVRAVSAGDALWDGRWRLEIIGPPFPPPRRGTIAGSDAVLTWRLIAGRITSLDLPSMDGYHAGP
jgi:ComEC/Rec2-related protein